MSTEQNMAIVRHAVEQIWNRGELDLADELFATDYVNHQGLLAELVRGPEAIKVCVALYRTAFPDFQITVEEVIADRDLVVLCWTACRARAGGRRGNVPAETQECVTGMTRSRHAAGKIMESWTYWERLDGLGGIVAARRAIE